MTEDWGGGVPRTHVMALVQPKDALADAEFYIICAHMQSRAEPKYIAARQAQADAIAEWLQDLRSPGGSVDLARGTPMVLFGDWNAYKSDVETNIATLLTGSIVHQQRFGPGGPPDCDEPPLRDARPLHWKAGGG